jgi:DNA-binding MarR family transcriptional regulator
MNARRPRAKTAIQELIEEVIVTFRQLRVTSAEVHGKGGLMPGQRGVLFDLARIGPQTVAGMARARGVSRQHIQALINRFRARGLVVLADNPAHRRSSLVVLTPGGKALVKAMLKRETAALDSLGLAIPAGEIRTAARVLLKLRKHLAQDPETPSESRAWRQHRNRP